MPQPGEIKHGREIGKADSVYHSHKYIWAACSICGKERWVDYTNSKPRAEKCAKCQLDLMHTPEVRRKISESIKKLNKSGAKHPMWKGGRAIDHEGYVHIYISPDDFFFPMASNGNRVREHRLVMAKHLGRCLLPWEVVHHKNGDKQDNKIENLALLKGRIYHVSITALQSENLKLHKRISELEKEIGRLKALE